MTPGPVGREKRRVPAPTAGDVDEEFDERPPDRYDRPDVPDPVDDRPSWARALCENPACRRPMAEAPRFGLCPRCYRWELRHDGQPWPAGATWRRLRVTGLSHRA